MNTFKTDLLIPLIIATILFLLSIVGELIYVFNTGTEVSAPQIPRETQVFGSGEPLKYLVMGDSTSISQGGDYDKGIATSSAKQLAEKHEVSLLNVGISGATVKQVEQKQLKKAVAFHPDIVLLSAGANDAKNFVSNKNIRAPLSKIVTALREDNPTVQVIVTGSPAMDSVSRFPFFSKLIMQLRTAQVNHVFSAAAQKYNLIVAPIAQETRQAFLDDPALTASDKFHPDNRGYALWNPVVNKAVDKALSRSDL